MKTEITTTTATVFGSHADSTKLASLLALSAGAIAMPQTGNADIIFTDLSSSPVQVGFQSGSTSSYLLNLPGTVLFGFERSETTVSTSISSQVIRSVVAADMFGVATAQIQAGPGSFAAPLPFDAPWNQGLPLTYTVVMGIADTSHRSPTSGYDHQYLGFRFQDSTQVTSPFRYGWIEVGLSITFVNPFGGSGGPNVTIYGYGWDNTGAQPKMGQQGGAVPEPSSAALMVIGALALGAPGLRKWRHSKDAAGKS
jgi:hypothetical protein